MFRPDHEVGVQGPGRTWLRTHPGQLVQEALHEVEGGIGIDRLQAIPQAGEGCKRGR